MCVVGNQIAPTVREQPCKLISPDLQAHQLLVRQNALQTSRQEQTRADKSSRSVSNMYVSDSD